MTLFRLGETAPEPIEAFLTDERFEVLLGEGTHQMIADFEVLRMSTGHYLVVDPEYYGMRFGMGRFEPGLPLTIPFVDVPDDLAYPIQEKGGMIGFTESWMTLPERYESRLHSLAKYQGRQYAIREGDVDQVTIGKFPVYKGFQVYTLRYANKRHSTGEPHAVMVVEPKGNDAELSTIHLHRGGKERQKEHLDVLLAGMVYELSSHHPSVDYLTINERLRPFEAYLAQRGFRLRSPKSEKSEELPQDMERYRFALALRRGFPDLALCGPAYIRGMARQLSEGDE